MKNFILIFIFIFSFEAFSQVAVNPSAIFIDPVKKSGEISIMNVSNEMREMEVKFRFGYHTYDENGEPFIEYSDSMTEKSNSLVPYVKAYPARLMLPPNERQTIRFMVQNTSVLKEGCYWARFIASSHPLVAQVDSVPGQQITAQISVNTELVGLVCYRHGGNTSGLEVAYNSCVIDTNVVGLVMKYNVQGNSPFWGSSFIEIYGQDGEKVTEKFENLAIYSDCVIKYKFLFSELPPGKYTGKIYINNERKSIEPQDRTPFDPIMREFEFTVPST